MSEYTEFFIGEGKGEGKKAAMLSYYHIIYIDIDINIYINTRETLKRVSTAKEMNRYLTISAGCGMQDAKFAFSFFLSFFLDYKAGFVHIIYV